MKSSIASFVQQLRDSVAEHPELYGTVRYDVPLAPYTTWKIGGPADVLVTVQSLQQLRSLLQFIHLHEVPWFILGRGSNLLITDLGVRGVVVQLGDAFEQIAIDKENSIITVGGAFSLIKLALMASRAGLSGFEFAGGIPASVGGAVCMNAGAHLSDIDAIFESATVVLADGTVTTYTKDTMQFTYRHSVLQHTPGVVVEATFRLKQGDQEQISAKLAANKERRLRTQPLHLPCCGSVFRNPDGDYAARLIEQCGLKGVQWGGAQVSPMHANFIINTGQATANDVIELMNFVQDKVKEQCAISLVPEVYIVGQR